MPNTSNNALCSVCGHMNYYHQKWNGVENICQHQGLNDAAHTFATDTETLWNFGVPFVLPEPILYADCDGNVRDLGGFISDGTWATGTEQYEEGVFGDANGALTADNASKVTFTNQAKYNIENTDAFSIQGWFKKTTAGNDAFISKMDDTANNRGIELSINNGEPRFIRRSTLTNRCILDSTQTTLNDDEWHHFVATCAGGLDISTMKIYIDGILDPGTVINNDLTTTIQTAIEWNLMARDGGTPIFLSGTVDEFAVWDQELTADAVAFLYNSGAGRRLGFNFRSGLLLYNKFDGNLVDETGDNTITLVAGTEQYADGVLPNAQSLDLDGAPSYVASDNEATFDFDITDPFSLAYWVKYDAKLSQFVITKNDVFSNPGWQSSQDTSFRFQFDLVTNTPQTNTVETSLTQTPGVWHHVVNTFDGSGNRNGMRIYVDGVIRATGAAQVMTGSALNNHNVTVGADADGGIPSTSQVQHFAVWNRELTAAEISFLYNGGEPLNF